MGASIDWTAVVVADRLAVEVDATYVNRQAFLEGVQIGPEVCHFFVASVRPVRPGTLVVARVTFSGEPGICRVLGQVVRESEAMRRPEGTGMVVAVGGTQVLAFARLYAHASRRPEHWGRRASDRLPTEVPISYQLGELRHAGMIRDLSRGGAWVQTAEALPPAQGLMRLRVELGCQRSVELVGRVVWSASSREKACFAVEFTEVGPEAQAYLDQALGELGS